MSDILRKSNTCIGMMTSRVAYYITATVQLRAFCYLLTFFFFILCLCIVLSMFSPEGRRNMRIKKLISSIGT